MRFALRIKPTVTGNVLFLVTWFTFPFYPGLAPYLVARYDQLRELPWLLALQIPSTVFGLALACYVINCLKTVRSEGTVIRRRDKLFAWFEVAFGLAPASFWSFWYICLGIAAMQKAG